MNTLNIDIHGNNKYVMLIIVEVLPGRLGDNDTMKIY